jgi:hypothetical protein
MKIVNRVFGTPFKFTYTDHRGAIVEIKVRAKNQQLAREKVEKKIYFSLSNSPEKGIGPLSKASQKRPDNYYDLPSDQQWAIDKKLGILDWNGLAEN